MKSTKAQEHVILNRTFDAPRGLIWKAYTEREHFEQWLMPKGFTLTIVKYDFREGGSRHWCLRSPDGKTMWEKSVFTDIVPEEKLTYVFSYSNEKGEIARSPYVPNFPLEVRNEISLKEWDGKTILTITGRPINCTEEEYKAYEGMRAGLEQGAKRTYDQLDDYVTKLKS